MSFKCDVCGIASSSGSRPIRIVTDHHYIPVSSESTGKSYSLKDKNGNTVRVPISESMSAQIRQGSELTVNIKKEKNFCFTCAKKNYPDNKDVIKESRRVDLLFKPKTGLDNSSNKNDEGFVEEKNIGCYHMHLRYGMVPVKKA